MLGLSHSRTSRLPLYFVFEGEEMKRVSFVVVLFFSIWSHSTDLRIGESVAFEGSRGGANYYAEYWVDRYSESKKQYWVSYSIIVPGNHRRSGYWVDQLISRTRAKMLVSDCERFGEPDQIKTSRGAILPACKVERQEKGYFEVAEKILSRNLSDLFFETLAEPRTYFEWVGEVPLFGIMAGQDGPMGDFILSKMTWNEAL